jgi:hypothetical protein
MNPTRTNFVYRRASPPLGGPVTALSFPQRTLIAVCIAVVSTASGSTQSQERTGGTNELDAFMEKVLARRDVNRQTLKQYILDEAEEFEIFGPGRSALHRTKREFTWYMRDGVHVRSPLKFNGVAIGAEERDRYERKWLEREKERQKREEEKRREKQ